MQKSIDTLRFLGLDMINEANSGHPGIVLGAAPMLYELFTNHLNIAPSHPKWFNRDRFVMSAGHGSALIYAMLHLAGYNLTIEDLKAFRSLDSKTPGHPEYHLTEGLDMTTGPLGQGLSHAVGMAMAESHIRAKYSKPNYPVMDHYTYVLASDGDLQEGVSFEALSLAGHLKLNRLIVLFDSNDIQLDGPVSNSASLNIQGYVESLGLDYQRVDDANDTERIKEALEFAKKSDKPSLIEVKSIIGYRSSKAGTSAVHGAPLGAEETMRLRDAFGYSEAPFEVSKDVIQDFEDKIKLPGQKKVSDYDQLLDDYAKEFPDEAKSLNAIINQEIPLELSKTLGLLDDTSPEATRVSIGKALEELSSIFPALMGGSADLAGSTKVKGADGPFSRTNRTGRNVNFGVREHAMAAIVNGLTLHHLRGLAGGFFTFSDYMKPSIRLASLMEIPALYVFTHDSVAIGEDGPTHQPIEQLAQFRSQPNLQVLRPADVNETRLALRLAVETQDKPSMLVCSRQNLPLITQPSYEKFKHGAYLVLENNEPDGLLIASGSEVSLALEAAELLKTDHQIHVNVVSVPSLDRFLAQDVKIQEKVLPKAVTKRLAIELGSPGLWYQLASDVLGMTSFGASGEGSEVVKHFGFTKETIVERYLTLS